MPDNRFPSPGVDARFPSPGTDVRFPAPGTDIEHPSPGVDARFEGGSYGGAPTAPAQFGVGDWSVTDAATNGDIVVNIATLPSNGGSAITALQYDVGASGSWLSLGGTATGNYPLSGFTDGVSISIRVRAVNAIGSGTASSGKSVTPTGLPATMVAGDWTLADFPSAGGDQLTVDLDVAPANGGSAITSYEFRRNGGSPSTLSGGTALGTRQITVLATTAADIQVRAVNAVGPGAWSDTKTQTPTVSGGTAFTRANVIANASTAGRTSGAALKIPGVDTMPSGASYSAGTITVTGNDVVFEDWKINRIIGSGLRCIIRQCEVEDTATGGANYPIAPTGADWIVEDCDLYGQGDPKGSSALIVTFADNFTVRRCYFVNYANDGLKLSGNNFLVEKNLIGPADNTATVATYNAGTYYAPGSYVSYTSTTFEKLSTAPAGTTPVDGADWDALDPHVDQITVSGGYGIIRYNHFNTQPAASGLTQRIRVARDTGASNGMGTTQIYGNVMDDWNGAYPLLSENIREWVSRTYTIGQFAGNAAKTVFWRATTLTTDNPEVDATDWVLDRDINTDGDHLYAFNFIEAGTSGLYNGNPAPTSIRENKDELGTDLGFFASNVAPALTAPTNVGDVVSYTTPVRYGPAQVFTITPTTYNGSARVDGVTYNNVCAIRVGIQFAGMIDSAGFWYVNPLMGITITPLGGGSYKLRIYDTAGNPMSASVSIPVGVATVTPNANESTTGPAWGTAPATMQTNNVPFAYNHTVMQTVGQSKASGALSTTSYSLDLSNVPLALNDFLLTGFGVSSNTDRYPDITTAGYTEIGGMWGNSSFDASGVIGYKQMSASPDTTIAFSTSAASASNSRAGVARGYRGAASISMVTAQGTGSTPTPPAVTATKNNSVVLIVAVVAHDGGTPGLSAGYGVNSDLIEYNNSTHDISIRVLEVEVNTGTYTPAALTYGGTFSASHGWWAATFLITPP